MTKEQIYADQMRELGTYDPAFEPEIHTLAMLERELTRTMKEWKDTAKNGKAPSATDKLYAVIMAQRKDILTHREALGLTPKAYKRMKPEALDAANSEPIGTANKQLSILLNALKEDADGEA